MIDLEGSDDYAKLLNVSIEEFITDRDQRLEELAERVAKVLALHQPAENTASLRKWCAADGRYWPCETVKILTGETDGD